MPLARKIIILVTLALLVPKCSFALDSRIGESITISSEDNIKDSVFVLSRDTVINGAIDGDLICLGQNVVVNAVVNGDILCLAQNIDINGSVAGSVRAIGNRINLASIIGRNVTTISSIIVVAKSAKVAMDVVVASTYAEVLGQIKGGLYGNIGKLVISGQVDQDVNVNIEGSRGIEPSLVVKRPAVIKGNLIYASDNSAWIINQASVAGSVSQQKLNEISNENELLGISKLWLLSKLIVLLATLVIASVIIRFFKAPVTNLAELMIKKPLNNILWGLLFLFIVPLASLALLFTIFGLPLAIVLMLLWFLSLLLGHALTAIMVGKVIFGHYKYKLSKVIIAENYKKGLFLPTLCGVALTTILFSLPWVGTLLLLIAIAWSIGAVWQSARD